MPTGTCKLCLSSGVELLDSHLMPKAGYRLLRKSQSGAPVVIRSDVTMSKDEQVRAHAFCAKCEERFNNNGERWVLQHCNRHGEGFALNEILDATAPEFDQNGLKVWAASKISAIDVAQLAYFAASLVWRASVHEWKSGSRSVITPKMGAIFEEQFRQYLLGYGPFPAKATLTLGVLTDKNLWNLIFFPYGTREHGYWRINVQFFGLVYMMWLGSLVPARFRRFCLYHSTEHFIARTPAADDMVLTHAGKLIAKSKLVGAMKARGKHP